ncbi:MAG: hypothetical protein IJW65_06475 [Clostridia bacterium]|nr:hypothetical protein [Clostridia bacterium]
MNCKLNLTPVCEFAKKAAETAKRIITPVCKKLSSIYVEYDLDASGKLHLTPAQTDEAGREQNVIETSSKGKIKLSAKDIICLLAIFSVVLSLVKRIARKMLK